MRKLKVLWRNALSPHAPRGARNLDRRAARARRGAAALRDADGAGRSRRGVSERARRADAAVSIRRRQLLGRGAAPDRLAHLRGRRRRARARRPALSQLRHELRRGRVRAAARRRCGRRSLAHARSASASSKARFTSVSRPSESMARRAPPANARASCGKRARICSRRPSPISRPASTIDITIEYLQTARYDAGEFSLRVPLTLTPRYGAPDTPEGVGALSSAVLPGAGRDRLRNGGRRRLRGLGGARSTPWHEAYVHAVLAPGMPLEWLGSRSHELSAVRERGRGMDGAPQRRIDRRTAAPPRACSCSRRRPSCTCSIRWRRACRWTATS